MSSVATLKTRETLRLCTAGSVDDGKSTFVGRLLHDTKSVLADQLESMEKSSKDRGFDGLDLSLLVDGLRAEREQGITIDVAYRYFATDKRTFIMADTPGHVQYTRNTVTGMSTSQVVVVLIDARHGVVEQTRRHLNVAALLGVRHVILGVNKIDLVDFSESVFRDIEAEFTSVANRLGIEDTHVVPISALRGDNVVEPSTNMPWYTGPTVLELLESFEVGTGRASELDFRLPIQYVIREHASDYRGYAGRIEAGSVKVGDTVYLDNGRSTTVTHIDRPEPAESAVNGDSVVLRLADDIDLARGDLISGAQRPEAVRSFEATVVALTEKDLKIGPMYKVRYGSKVVKGRITSIERVLDLDGVDFDVLEPEKIALNDIAHVSIEVAEELPVEDYAARGAVGNFLVTDSSTGNTLAAGLIGHRLR
ncbi:MAG: 50S ribosome-binding GTPase [Corynebacterium sp.]|jgi:sulfate adenylyltransferase subunit 1|uniref:Sulfate adenylyltransferase n=1 Tax=Corynebacterium stationis TaxID=1705 RepID=A0A177INH1_9CORY|nr:MULTISPECIES: GTP-binding protein [Corynebacterium]APT95941.1 sulfate adenylyltransferase [Corynebacterium stationis]NWO15291.1 50S ribosome-binding GTPase [Corynebacterium sp.]OAH30372.1 sulfate adenylyltransferase [Corynebacterium stationis]HCM80608.1 sulfate adenylyltransferase [Corynebacterium stationis]HHT59766.1 sulfate adenylyltransferase [Corynebacterium stationis]